MFFSKPHQWFIGGGQAGGGWGAEGGLFHTCILAEKHSHCVFIEVHKQPQFTCLANTVADSSSTPSVALLVCLSGAVHSIVDCPEFTTAQSKFVVSIPYNHQAVCICKFAHSTNI